MAIETWIPTARANAVLDRVFAGATLNVPTVYQIALLTTLPTAPDGTGLVEVSTFGTNYARINVNADATRFPAAASRSISNGSQWLWPASGVATVDWGRILGFAMYDNANPTVLHAYGTFWDPSKAGVVTASNNRIAIASHGLVVDNTIMVEQVGALSLAGLAERTVYWVKTVVDSNTITISATQGGAEFDLTADTTIFVHKHNGAYVSANGTFSVAIGQASFKIAS